MPHELKSHRTISIRVAYGWSGDVRTDARWIGVRNFLNGVVKEAEGRFKRRHSESPPPVEVRRLKAIAGQPIGASIFKRIRETDVFVADISHRTREGQRERTANVLVELGAALANGRRTEVFVVEDVKKGAPLEGIADLSGVLIGVIKADESTKAEDRTRLLNSDTGLRTRLVSVVLRLLRERAGVAA